MDEVLLAFPGIGLWLLRPYGKHVYCGAPLLTPAPIDPSEPLHHAFIGHQVTYHVI